MSDKEIENVLKNLINNFIQKRYKEIFDGDHGKLISAEELREGIEDYPGCISSFPDSAFDVMRVYRHSDADCDLDFPLWYDNQRSDLTMVLNIKLVNNEPRYTIEGILVQ